MMLKNRNSNQSMISQFAKFQSDLARSGQNPSEILNSLIASGKVNKEQLEKATTLAKTLGWLIK